MGLIWPTKYCTMMTISKKEVSSNEAHFYHGGQAIKLQKCSIWGLRNLTYGFTEANAIITSNCLVRRRHHWPIFLRTFDGRLICRNGNVNWPEWNYDLTLFPWSFVQVKCYADKPQTVEYLKAYIRDAIAKIQHHTLDKVYVNLSNRERYCKASQTSHMNEMILKPEQLYFTTIK